MTCLLLPLSLCLVVTLYEEQSVELREKQRKKIFLIEREKRYAWCGVIKNPFSQYIEY